MDQQNLPPEQQPVSQIDTAAYSNTPPTISSTAEKTQFVCPLAAKLRKRPLWWRILKFVIVFAVVAFIILAITGTIMLKGFQEKEYAGTNFQQRIALIDLTEMIDMANAMQVHDMLRQAQNDNTVRGVILVVNCPGGQVVPSEMISRYIDDFTKPIYTCIEQLGASGAYWVACSTDRIYAQTNSIVGSIGVIYMQFILQEALEENLGIEPIVITSSRAIYKDRGSPFRQPTEEERQETQTDLDTVHDRFVAAVSQGRDMPESDVWPLANGDVFDGIEALDNGLIDRIGFLEDVIDDMTSDLSLTDPQVIRYVPAATLSDMLQAGFDNHSSFNIEQIRQTLTESSGIMALWPGNR
ncbi:MAG: signal peptide peptidase SppA [Sedimentisphaerales bacterium]|nr:signal peptide peptidase SppA [Sedimentisphaerales bacterium]